MDVIGELQQEKGTYEVAAQYYLNPADPGNLWFPYDQVKAAEFDPSEEWYQKLRPKLQWYFATDPAESTENPHACFTGDAVVGVDPETGIWYVEKSREQRLETPQICDFVIETCQQYKPVRAGLDIHSRKALDYTLKDRMMQQHAFFNVEPLKPVALPKLKNQKEFRIKSLKPLFEFKRIKISRVGCEALLRSLYTLPAARFRDAADALGYIMQLVPATHRAIKTSRPTNRFTPHWPGTGY
jgi:hypothetical protein